MMKLLLFDIDGTLTESFQAITQDIKDVLLKCKKNGYNLALVSGSDIIKVKRQLGTDFLTNFIYIFCENGTQAYRNGELFSSENILDHVSDELLNELVNFTLCYIANLDIPKKRGCFFECRKSLINISPIGRNCSYDERNEFFELDTKLNIRETMKYELERKFKDTHLQFSIGGKISIDCYPKGWSKVFVLKFLDDFDEIHFFGDMVHQGGNDHELYVHKRTIGHQVTSFNDTINKLKAFT